LGFPAGVRTARKDGDSCQQRQKYTPPTPLINGSHTITATSGASSAAVTDMSNVNLSGAGGGTMTTSFSGITDPTNNPPENALAVGPSYVVMAESSKIEWTNLSGGAAFTESLYTLFSPLGASATNSLLDARVVFDSVNQRFVVMAENLGTNLSNIDIAVSKDANPNDGWYVGSFNSLLTINGDVTTYADMPYLSVDGKNIYVSENQYGTSKEGTQETVFSNSIYSGGALTVVASQVAPASVGNARNVTGANGLTFYVSNAPASGQDVLTIQNFDNTTSTFGAAATTINLGNSDQGASAADYTVAQKGTSLLLDAYDSRIASLSYANGFVYGLMEIEPTGTTVPEIQWFKIDVSNPAAPTLAAQGVVTGGAIGSGVGVFNGSLAVDAAGDLLINFTASSTNMFPSDYYVYQAAGGSSFSAPTLYQASTGFFDSGVAGAQRWGTYSTAIVDPNNPNSFWISNEYVANNWWQTVTAQVQLPPLAPTITTPASGSTDTTTFEPVISGGGVTGDTVTINIDGVEVGTALVVNSAWSFTPATALANSSHTITATQAAASGPSSTAAADTFTVSVPPPAPTITAPAKGGTNATADPLISGGGVTGDTVTVNIDGVEVGTATVVNSAWSFTLATALANSSHTITATQAAATGPSSAAAADTFTVNVANPPAVQTVHTNDISRSGDVTGAYNFIDLANLEAGYSDLIHAFGTNTQAMQNWFNSQEPGEKRPDTFDGLDYIASYGDLINAFKSAGSEKSVLDDGASHYITNGLNEGRTTTFNGLDYIASYADLIKAFGVDGDAGAYHYIEHGVSEGRTTTFDGLDYIASYTDLIKAFGANEQAGAEHFIQNGYNEGRTTTFDGLDYIAGYTDLMTAFGANNDAGASHFITNGFNEGRSAAPFNVGSYESAHPDLIGKYASNDAFLTAYINTYVTSGKFLT